MEPFLGTEAIAQGRLTRGQLRWNHIAVHPNVYVAGDQPRTLLTNAHAAWLWSGRRGIVAGRAAAGLHGIHTVDHSSPIDLIGPLAGRQRGVVIRQERIADDEIQTFGPLRITTPERTALDLARRMPRDAAVRDLDALAGVTGVDYADVAVLLDRYVGMRGIRQARTALELMDGGTGSPEETHLRLLLIDGGLPRPRTNIVVGEGVHTAVIGVGWAGAKVGVGVYDGSQRDQYAAVQYTKRQDVLHREGWVELQVASLDSPPSIRWRVRDALRRRGMRV